MAKDLYEIGEIPPVGEVPARMHAQLVRPDRYGEPQDAIRDEVVDVPELGPTDVLVLVMAAGVNFNNVWAARGVPIDVTTTQARWGEPTDFHIVGSDAAGIVYAVGSDVRGVEVGDHVVVHAGQWDPDDPWVVAGNDPGLAPTFRVWGYDTCWGSMAQFTKVQAHQCLPKGEALTWEEAAAPTLTGCHRVPDAARMAAEHRAARRRRARVGRSRRARVARDPARVARGWSRGRGRVLEGEGRALHRVGRGRHRRPDGLLALGRAAGVGLAGRGRPGSTVRRRSARRSGRRWARRRARGSSSSIRGRTPSRPRTSSATEGA